MSQTTPTETEVKIPVTDLAVVRACLTQTDAQQVHPPQREVNILLDSSDRTLEESQRVLRLRRIGDRQLLTLKGPARFEDKIKHREELEIEVSDIDTLMAIFHRLGYAPVLRYEKDRETWNVNGVTVTLDHTPMGNFIELEGEKGRLSEVATTLGVTMDDAVRGSYVSLWQDHRARNPELDLPPDMVFPS